MAAAAKVPAKAATGATTDAKATFHSVSDRVNFSAEEEKVLKYWNEIKAFETSLKLSEGRKPFTFYDGPPFATGLPHYGHILAGTIKDTITRYAHMTGHYVERRFGWDCHGLPVEYEIDQKLGIKGKEDVMKMGVAAYNAECRSIVTRYCGEWEQRVARFGRWIDFKNDYKTMDLKFMESVWWVFKQLHKKELVYRGFKVMPYSTACTTPLSNFEANLNYKMVTDPAVVVSFPLVKEPGTALLAWTTTPWTLPSNMACTVHPDLTYVKIKDTKTGAVWIVGETRLEALYPKGGGQAKMGGADKNKSEDLYGESAMEHVGLTKSAKKGGAPAAGAAAAAGAGADAKKGADKGAAADKGKGKSKADKKEDKKDGAAAAAPAAAAAGDDKKGKKEKGAGGKPKDDKPKADAAVATAAKADDKKTDKKADDKKQADKKAKGGDKKGDANDAKEKGPIVHNSPHYTVLQTYKGSELKGMEYTPLFSYFADKAKTGAFRVLCDGYVTDDSGTGIVHSAPAFGEDDYRCCIEGGVIRKGEALVCPVDANGRFTEEVKDWAGVYVKAADADIIAHLKAAGRLISDGSISHSYPFCWRSETPLIYRAVPSWFVRVDKLKANLLKNNKETYWVPDFVKEKRFHNWLAEAKDWAISRNRYWGTPLPIWMSEDEQELVVIESVEELKKLSGVQDITDLHKDKIDHITIPSKRDPTKVLRRVEEVFDCWFESGSMPYAQQHYPFENKEKFDKGFPADFIAEGLDQTRGWFYTLMVISTALFDKPPFRNLIVNGLVLAGDGKKMSKRLKNYPDPLLVVSNHGADALRLYLVNSPVVRAEPLRFQEEGVFEIVKNVLLPWFHTYRFFVENAQRYETVHKTKFLVDAKAMADSTNIMDKWILASLQSLVSFVRKEMIPGADDFEPEDKVRNPGYRLYTVVPKLLTFLTNLSNWYVRGGRKRAKGGAGAQDMLQFLSVLGHVLLSLARLMAPFTPFFSELTYQNLKHALPVGERVDSVHYLMIPTKDKAAVNPAVEQAVSRMQVVVELGRAAREKRSISLKRPLRKVTVVHTNAEYLRDVKTLEAFACEELNVRTVEFSSDVSSFITLKAAPNRPKLGKKAGAKMRQCEEFIAKLTSKDVTDFKASGSLSFQPIGTTDAKDKILMTAEDVDVTVAFNGDTKRFESATDNDVLVVLDVEPDAELIQAGVAREFINRVQRLRKKAGLVATDMVEVFYSVAASAAGAGASAGAGHGDAKDEKKQAAGAAAGAGKADVLNPTMESVVTAQAVLISTTLRRHVFPVSAKPVGAVVIATDSSDCGSGKGEVVTIEITRPALAFSADAKLWQAVTPAALSGAAAEEFVAGLKLSLQMRDHASVLAAAAAAKGALPVSLDGHTVTLLLGKHFFASCADAHGKKPIA